jgi:ribosomal protein S18 acetylase RimI-like enzyme
MAVGPSVWEAGPVTEVRIAGVDEADEVGAVLAEGFGDDPVMSWVFAEPGRHEKLLALFGFVAGEASVPLGATYVVEGACAVWTPPGTPDWPDEVGRRFVEEVAPACTPADLERLGVLDATMTEHHPAGEHWYLGELAARPTARGRGLGTTLLQASLARVDGDGLPAYLESTNPRNVSLYLRHGFEVTGTIELPGGPSLTAMWREPRTA